MFFIDSIPLCAYLGNGRESSRIEWLPMYEDMYAINTDDFGTWGTPTIDRHCNQPCQIDGAILISKSHQP